MAQVSDSVLTDSMDVDPALTDTEFTDQVLSIRDLGVSVGDKELLNIHSLSAGSGQLITLLGANGAGKSTLFKSITGEVQPDDRQLSRVEFHGKPVSGWPSQSLARHLGVLPQASQLSFPFTVKEVVGLGLIPLTASRAEGQCLVAEAMKQTDTAHFADRIYTQLSGGERQRVHLARVLVQLSQAEQTPLLLLDEPTSAQDLGQQHQILRLAQQLCHEKQWTVIAILHDLNQALRYCDQVWLLEQGRLIEQGLPSNVLTQSNIERVWGYRPELVMTEQGHVVLA
ncbi:heme ABC transporter ATP-binding protein [Litoribrevibacter albus]|uniref:Hemin import ATP-binding protein HmuV n=1 Tax=Litoribrevibacter albus TaxID=1473156 RepID=A0AA37S8I8_9GAMM|nr:heme ABC transporter ATP-binding protein [Litoribrevibacter albus]GLQ30339.1 hemin import ATP-binding protein HmuV [Litoribrevibacter albus]